MIEPVVIELAPEGPCAFAVSGLCPRTPNHLPLGKSLLLSSTHNDGAAMEFAKYFGDGPTNNTSAVTTAMAAVLAG